MAALLLGFVILDTFLTGLLLGKYNELRKITKQTGEDLSNVSATVATLVHMGSVPVYDGKSE